MSNDSHHDLQVAAKNFLEEAVTDSVHVASCNKESHFRLAATSDGVTSTTSKLTRITILARENDDDTIPHHPPEHPTFIYVSPARAIAGADGR